MSCHWGRCWVLSAVLALGGLAGCGMFGGQGMPDDPLFLDRKPVEAKAKSAPPAVLAHSEPVPPSNPYFAEERPKLVGPRTPQKAGQAPGVLTSRPPAAKVEPDDD